MLVSASISTVERDTGLSKDTLRVWERRYGFPNPSRDAKGERLYAPEQVEKLRVIRRLMDVGVRPSKIAGDSLAALKSMLTKRAPAAPTLANVEAEMANEVLRLIKDHAAGDLKSYLAQGLMRVGLQRFALEIVAPLNEVIGVAWLEGRIQVFEEHLYSEQVQQLLRQAINAIAPNAQGPRVLLTTLPGEQHQLGLLMAEAFMAVEGASCISLGVQTPASDIVQAARAHRADVVGLSFSPAIPVHTSRTVLADLRRNLDATIELWAGGSVWRHARKFAAGVTTISTLDEIPGLLTSWHAKHAAH